MEIDEVAVLQRTGNWLKKVVCDLNLCPFAGPVVEAGRVCMTVSKAADTGQLLIDFLAELDNFQTAPEAEIATCLLILPAGLEDFDNYLDFLAEAQILLEKSGLADEIQLASFHPDYIFEGESELNVSHFTNRSPYPMVHLIREAMLSRELENFSDPEQIPQKNIQRLRAMGIDQIQRLWSSL